MYFESTMSLNSFCCLASSLMSCDRYAQKVFLWCIYFRWAISCRITISRKSMGKITRTGDRLMILKALHCPRILFLNFLTLTSFALMCLMVSISWNRRGSTSFALMTIWSRILIRNQLCNLRLSNCVNGSTPPLSMLHTTRPKP